LPSSPFPELLMIDLMLKRIVLAEWQMR